MLFNKRLVKVDGHEFYITGDARSCAINAILLGNDKTKLELKEPKVLLDLGANIGIWSFLMAKKYPEARIIAVEPMPINVQGLIEGIELNKLENVGVIQAAISDREELVMRWHPVNNEAPSEHLPKIDGLYEERVKGIGLNDLFEWLDCEFDFVKMDIEGSEFDVFWGFKYWDRIKAMSIEVHPYPRFKSKKSGDENSENLMNFIRSRMKGKPVEFFPMPASDDEFHILKYPDIDKYGDRLKEIGESIG